MKVKPCGTQLLIKLEEVKELSDGGIVMRSKTEHKREEDGRNMGRVLALGPLAHADWDGFDSDKPAKKYPGTRDRIRRADGYPFRPLS